MEPQFFGQFLIEKGTISSEQLELALSLQKKMGLRLGELAVQNKFITEDQLQNILKLQKDIDNYFGELAIKLGYLQEPQLHELVVKQQKNHIFIGEALITTGILNREQLEKLLEEFHYHNDPINILGNCIPQNIEFGDELLSTLEVTVKTFKRFCGVDLKIGQGIAEQNSIVIRDLLVQVPFRGSTRISYFLNFSYRARVSIAKTLHNSALISDDRTMEILSDLASSICKFLNEHFNDMGHKFSIEAPVTFLRQRDTEFVLDEFKKTLFFPAMIPEGPIGIYVAMA